MLARLHILAHTARRNSTSSTGAKAKKVVVPLIPPKRIYIYIYEESKPYLLQSRFFKKIEAFLKMLHRC